MNIITTIPDRQYFDLEIWIHNARAFEKIQERKNIELYYYIFSNDNVQISKRPIILCRTIIENEASICIFLQTYYYKGEYSTIDCICLKEDNCAFVLNNYFKYILTDEISKTNFNLITNNNRFITCHNQIININNNLEIVMPEKIFMGYNIPELVNFIFYPTVRPHLTAKSYIEKCLQTMMDNSTEKDYYQKLFNLYQNQNLVKNIYKQDQKNTTSYENYEDILGELDVKINRENIFKESKQSCMLA